MTLKEIFDQLSLSELLKLHIGGAEQGGIQPENYGKIVSHINLALDQLHQRFYLREGRAVLTLENGKTVYDLSGDDLTVVLTDENGGAYGKDLLKLEQVSHEDGYFYGLNEKNNPFSMITVKPTVLRMPAQWKDNQMPSKVNLVYRASLPPLVLGPGDDPATVEVDFPRSFLWALLLFVASRAHTPMGMSNEFHAGNSYYAKYEAECQRLENTGLQMDQGSYNNRLKEKGWV